MNPGLTLGVTQLLVQLGIWDNVVQWTIFNTQINNLIVWMDKKVHFYNSNNTLILAFSELFLATKQSIKSFTSLVVTRHKLKMPNL